MVKKIVGYDDKGKVVFERNPREMDNLISNHKITISEVIRVVPILVLLVTVYVNQQNFNTHILRTVDNNSQAIAGIKEVLANLNNYMSSSTGKQFHNGIPR